MDAFDPTIFERLADQGKLPNLAQFVLKGGYSPFRIANPPQSEVSWTSIATGLNPGGHGIFDFVHRAPGNYAPIVSLLPTRKKFSGTQFVSPTTAQTIFDHAIRRGFPATSLWWPATFPARPGSPVRSIPGLGTPDILGKLGVGTLYSLDGAKPRENAKTRVEKLTQVRTDHYCGELHGVVKKVRGGVRDTTLSLSLELLGDGAANLTIGKRTLKLREGIWSPIVEIAFDAGLLMKVHAITRVILTAERPEPKLYFLPLQIHPLRPLWDYAAPRSFVKKTWQACGPFLSIGWPQDTTGLEDGCISGDQFLHLCEDILSTREKILALHLRDFNEGVLAAVFDSLDRLQHMFWREHQDIVEHWYLKLDGLVGRFVELLSRNDHRDSNLIIVSDHGFNSFDYKVHLNRWLIEKGFLTPVQPGSPGGLSQIDWAGTKAYALGLNSVYLNLEGREGKGVVAASEAERLVDAIARALMSWKGPDGKPVVSHAYTRSEALRGALTTLGPDLLVGYAHGYRASQETGLGGWGNETIQRNTDHWSGDHCIDPQLVPGVVFCNRGLGEFSAPSYYDFPQLAVGEELSPNDALPPPTDSGEDHEVLEERLRSLGYL